VPSVSRFRVFATVFLAALLLLSLLHCGDSTPRASMPQSLDGGWTRTSVEPIDVAAAPESLKRLGVTSGQSSTYEREGRKVPVRVYELPSGTAAFEAQQTFTRSADEYYFTMGASFVVVEASTLANEERRPFLMAFVEAARPANASQEQEPQEQK
jgi:hypothetical protein